MQTTLLGLAIAAILALVAALVGPQFVDWGQHRARFETEATRFVGQPVRIRGAIDVRLLPVPTVVLRDVEVGSRAAPAFGAQVVGVELALSELMRGEIHAASLSLTGPEIGVALDANGRIVSHLNSLGLELVGIDRLAVIDGRLLLEDSRSRTRTVLEKLDFAGEVRAQTGQVKGAGAFAVAGQNLRYQLTTGRRDGSTRVRLNLESADRPLVFETDGNLSFEQDSPKFEGSVSFARPAGVVLDSGKTLAAEPWRITGKVVADARAALFEQVEALYGPDERRLRLGGTAEFKFGSQPQFDVVLSSRQLDLDRTMAASGGSGSSPLATLGALVDALNAAGPPPVPVSLGIGIDVLTLGGSNLQGLRADVKSADRAWSIDTFEFRAPGATQVRVSGRIADSTAGGSEFSGPVSVESADPSVLLAWLEGSDRRAANLGALKLRSDITIGRERLAIERINAEFDRKPVEGRLAYVFATGSQRARLDVALTAAEFDVEGAYGIISTALAGSKLDKPGEVSLAVDLGKTTFAGIAATGTKANLRLDPSGLRIERLAVADFGGAALSASGRIDIAAEPPVGSITVNLAAPKLDGVVAVIDKFYPGWSDRITRHAARLSPARLEATLSVDPPSASAASAGVKPASAKIALNGQLGSIKLMASGDGVGTMATIGQSNMRLNIRANGDDALTSLLGLEAVAPSDRGAVTWVASANGVLNGDMRIDTRLTGEGYDVAAAGTLKLSEPALTGALTASLTSADVRGVRRPGAIAFPVALKSNVRIAGEVFEFKQIGGKAGAADVKGEASLRLPNHQMKKMRVDGKIAADALDVASVLAAMIGAPAAVAPTQGTVWPNQPFAATFFSDLEGRIEFEAARATLPSPAVAQKLRGAVLLSPAAISFEKLSATLGGGNISGQASFDRVAAGLSLRGQATIAKADATAVLRAGAPAPIAGRVSGQVSFESTGSSPAALIAGLRGTGDIALENGKIAGLDLNGIDAGMRAYDRGAVTAPRVTEAVTRALDTGSLALPTTQAPVEITNGRVRLGKLVSPASADVGLGATLDLVEETLDARVTLLGSRVADVQGLRPELIVLYKGPPSAPRRTIDVTTLMNWLTLQSVERESKKLEVEERELKRREALQALIKQKLDEQANAVPVTGATPQAPQASSAAPVVAPAAASTPPVGVPPAFTVAPAGGATSASSSNTGLFAPTLPVPQLIAPTPRAPASPPPASSAAVAPPLPPPVVVPRVGSPAAGGAITAAAPSAPEVDDDMRASSTLPDIVPLPPRRPRGAVLTPADLATPPGAAPRSGTIWQHNAPH